MKRYLPILCMVAGPMQLLLAAPRPITPLKPSQLITYLPATPDQWTMKVSIGGNNFTGGWVTAFAERDFTQNPPPPTPGTPPAPFVPATMRINLSDTGYKTDFTAVVTAPASGAPSNFTYFKIGSFPARMIKGNDQDKSILLNFLVKNRFLFEVRTTNLRDDLLKKYLESLDYTSLMSTPDSGDTTISDPVVLSRVDELHPENTRSYPLYWSNTAPR